MYCFDCLEQVSKVRLLTMDHWSHAQVLQMLEGGNDQLREFFAQHSLGEEPDPHCRYRTKAARFYRDGIEQHTARVQQVGVYQGREASRELPRSASP